MACFVYSYFSKVTGKQPLYVGKTVDLSWRMQTHAKKSIWYDVWDTVVMVYTGEDNAACAAIELEQIELHTPKFNYADNPDRTISISAQKEGLRIKRHILEDYIYNISVYDIENGVLLYKNDPSSPLKWESVSKILKGATKCKIVLKRHLTETFDSYQSKMLERNKLLNEARLDITRRFLEDSVKACDMSQGYYSKFSLDSYQLKVLMHDKLGDICKAYGVKKNEHMGAVRMMVGTIYGGYMISRNPGKKPTYKIEKIN